WLSLLPSSPSSSLLSFSLLRLKHQQGWKGRSYVGSRVGHGQDSVQTVMRAGNSASVSRKHEMVLANMNSQLTSVSATTHFASIITLLFAALVFFAAFEAPMMVEGQQPKYCRKQSKTWSGLCTKSGSCKKQCIRVEKAAHEAPTMVEAQKLCERPSGTWSGVCGNNNACKNQCINLEKARHGSCNYVFPAHKCICYFPC
ncbi:hypothetical protein HID58_047518, partial [Brassica napus]